VRRATTKAEELRSKLDRLADESERLRADCAAAESVETPLVDEIEARGFRLDSATRRVVLSRAGEHD
jgi:hypothetical protein